MILKCWKKPIILSFKGVYSISSVKLKFLDRRKSAVGENNILIKTDAKRLKHGEQTGLETPVVHALTDESETSK